MTKHHNVLSVIILGIVWLTRGAVAQVPAELIEYPELILHNGTVLTVDDNDTVYSYQLMAGAAFNLTENFSLTAEYRYFDTITDAELTLEGGLGTIENSDIRSHEVRFGIRYWIF